MLEHLSGCRSPYSQPAVEYKLLLILQHSVVRYALICVSKTLRAVTVNMIFVLLPYYVLRTLELFQRQRLGKLLERRGGAHMVFSEPIGTNLN